MVDPATLELRREGHVVHVLLNRPEQRNAIDTAMFADLRETALALGADPGVRAVVLSGAGGTFSSGLDLSAITAMAGGGVTGDQVAETGTSLSTGGATPYQQIGWAWQEIDVPVIAAIEGYALGGGLNVALGADIRVVAPDARLGFVEITWGLVPDLSGTEGARRVLPLDVAKRLILTGELVTGQEAVTLGLATQVAADPVAQAWTIARAIAANSPDAVRAAKRLLNRGAEPGVARGLGDEVATSAALVGTPNQVEAVLARLEKRPALYADPELD